MIESVHTEFCESSGSDGDTERVFLLRIRNYGTQPVHVRSTKLLLPEKASVQRVEEASILGLQRKHEELCAQLTLLLNREMFVGDEFAEERVNKIVSIVLTGVEGKSSGLVAVLRQCLRYVTRPLIVRTVAAKVAETINSFSLRITCYEDAKRAVDAMGTTLDDRLRGKIQALLNQLEGFEKEYIPCGRPHLTTVAGGNSFEEHFTVRLPQALFSVRAFNLAVVTRFSAGSTSEETRASLSVKIPPRHVALTLLAMFCSLVSAGIHYWHSNAEFELPVALKSIGLAVVIAAALAQGMGRIQIRPLAWEKTWPSAVAVGIISGFFRERILAALEALFGLSW